MNLGENIHSFRVASNMSQTDLANELEVSRQSVSKWENNSAQPELDKLCRMSELFDVTLDELVYGVRPQQNNTPAGGTPGMTLRELVPGRVLAGSALLLFGMVFFLLAIFWGDRLKMGEVLAEFLSVNIALLGLAMVATYNARILAVCGVAYLLYAMVCFGIFSVTSMTNYLFMFLAGMVLLVWFITWGLHAEKAAKIAE